MADDTPAARAELVAIDGGYEILVTDAGTGAVVRRRIGILSVAMLAEQSARALAAHARAASQSGSDFRANRCRFGAGGSDCAGG